MATDPVREAAEELLRELNSLGLPRVNAAVKVKDGFPCFYCGTPLDPNLRDRRDELHTALCSWKIAMQTAKALREALDATVSPVEAIRWVVCPNGDYHDERATTFDNEHGAVRYAEGKNADPVDGEVWGAIPLYPATASKANVRDGFFYGLLDGNSGAVWYADHGDGVFVKEHPEPHAEAARLNVEKYAAPSPSVPRDEAVRHRPGHRPPVGFNAVVEIVSTSDLENDDVIFAEGRWLCVIDDGMNDSMQVMAAEIIDDAAGRGLADTTYGEWFARVVELIPKETL